MPFIIRLIVVIVIVVAVGALYVWLMKADQRAREERKTARAQRIKNVLDKLAEGKEYCHTRTNEHERRALLEELLSIGFIYHNL